MKKKRRQYRFLPFCLFIILMISFICYSNVYYHSEDQAESCLISTEQVKVTEIQEGLLFDGPGTDAALIFYPGAKVEYTAYAPLLSRLADSGIDCFLLKMPCNLAIFGQNKADAIIQKYIYGEWFLAGHSLGGAMAASYASAHMDKLNGLILLAAYPTKSLVSETFSVLTVYGSEDMIVNQEKLETGRSLMPQNYTEVCLSGANHAGFGNYGAQKGDGEAAITQEEQQIQTINAILAWIK